MPTLSLCIPAYNAAWCLPRLLDSAMNQTVPFDEIWVYDDCSTDQTAAVAEQYGARVVRGQVNRGCSHGKNVLAQHCTTDWIHFHDADDELMPRFVELAHAWMQEDQVDVVLFPYEERDEDKNALLGIRYFDDAQLRHDPRSYAIRQQINPFCGIYRRMAFVEAGGYDEDPLLLYNEDAAFHISLAFANLRFAAANEVCIINYRRLNSMSSANRLKCLQAQYQVMKKTVARPLGSRYAKEVATRLWLITGGLTAELDWATADAAAELATKLAGRRSVQGGAFFRTVALLSPPLALRLREILIRLLKPRYRVGYPEWKILPQPRPVRE